MFNTSNIPIFSFDIHLNIFFYATLAFITYKLLNSQQPDPFFYTNQSLPFGYLERRCIDKKE